MNPLLLLLPLLQATPESPLLGGDIRTIELMQPPGTRVEHFRLELAGNGGKPVGLVQWITGPDPEIAGGWRVEQDVIFFGEVTHVIHTERLHRDRRKLVWREVRPRSGRTHLLEWTPDGRVTKIDTVGGDLSRSESEFDPTTLLPLALIEHARRGTEWDGPFSVYQPLSGTVEPLQLSTAAEGPERLLELRREDGTLAGSYRFRGESLVGFRWQAGDLSARAIDAGSFREMSELAEEDDSRDLDSSDASKRPAGS